MRIKIKTHTRAESHSFPTHPSFHNPFIPCPSTRSSPPPTPAKRITRCLFVKTHTKTAHSRILRATSPFSMFLFRRRSDTRLARACLNYTHPTCAARSNAPAQSVRRTQNYANRLYVSRGSKIPPPSLRAFLPRADLSSLLASCGTNLTSLQRFISRTHITNRRTALTENPARAEEFGTRARVLPLLRCTSALGTQIVAALRLQIRLRKSVRI